ncbi:fumarylacetoacetate hydrolase family protein [Marinobacter sp. CHS3-4]|uniref:fumarylacetoacetate hydrolase family protein n=1 Tax=Marinobacter sp. CHS3-4 TaxID=3045174 RepID=UPI0024B5770C|nr:fumarylacetoacetate hydrolase family protein [Marinobacter sp. CHS3-4]MDI9244628.1 fumarylacetoacetate hydrolase family protein [Marinobacter sp. CHS3-4]
MSLNIVRFQRNNRSQWGILIGSQVVPLEVPCTSTGELIEMGRQTLKTAARDSMERIDVGDLELLSPITSEAKVLCQGANYRQHMIDSGMNPDDKSFNMFFTKSSASITGPNGKIIKPKAVRLLDYEVELTLVLGKRTSGPEQVNASNLHDYVAGICIGNDISARDIQIPQMQFHKGKSYRTFCPLGPVLCLLEPEEIKYLDNLQLELRVNDGIRQRDNTGNLVFKPAETLTEYSQIHDFDPGDVLMTGTPSGCALGLPSPLLVKVAGLLPEARKWAIFLKGQSRRPQYLKAGDRIDARIASPDGRIDLGHQSHIVVDEV